ncbi:hypothetical protein G1C96_1664 [Bifidobacterium sp. DSM 109958]|uniref:FAD-binding FR-type domain-containing protein n=1 Tax=Bifidobacterium moraviense TaxID=2675323 RepID=A0A7Y0F2Y9_9BIFI|nr:hypothetical protein [Bifidobacterium sp. DSM 109958]NMN01081.1 hypothetical protein [Bifidobacterium sp. DSM 109958]
MKRINTTVTLAWAVILFVVPLPLLATLAYGLPSIYADQLFGIEIGVVAYTWMLAAVYLACRPRWVDRTVGLPHMYMIHGMLAILAIAAAFVHQSLLPGAGALIGMTGHMGLYLFMAVAVWSLVFMAGWLTSRVAWLARLKRTLERLFRHEMSVWLHRLNLVAIALIVLHVHVIDYIAAIRPFILLFDALTIAVFAYYVWSVIARRAYALRGRVASVRPLADRVNELAVTLEGAEGRATHWNPGDFAFIAFPGERGMHEYHPFSLTNARQNNVPQDGTATSAASVPPTMTFAIRADGDFTSRIAALRPGTDVRVIPPYGRYAEFIRERDAHLARVARGTQTAQNAPASPLVLIGGGIGITPLLGVLTAYAGTGRPVDLLYTARGDRDFIYRSELERFASSAPATRVRLVTARPDDALIAPMIRPDAAYLVAGPHGMMVAVRRILAAHGVPADAMYYEPFSM